MAHMSPVMWLYMFIMFIFLFMLFIILNYSSFIVFVPVNKNS